MPSSYQFVLWKQESFLVPSAFFRNLLGVVLYEMTTGQRPFREQLASRLTDAILHQLPIALVIPEQLMT